MNRNDFLNMIGDNSTVNRQMIGEVYELIDIFPYFQSAHMLLLKGLQSNADVKFENQLRNSSIHIADREVLYYLLKEESKSQSGKPESKQENVPAGSDNMTEQTVIETAKNSDGLINEIENSSSELNQNENQDSLINQAGHSILVSQESESEELDGVMILEDEDTSPNDGKIFFMDPGFSLPERSDLLELDLDEELSDATDDVVTAEDKQDKQEDLYSGSRQPSQSELIDKFIIANPRIEPNRDKNGSPNEDLSKPSVMEDGGFVTETLARIFINQGYYSKAVDIYEKLSLKFPEKSSYFASQIEKVKEYIKK